MGCAGLSPALKPYLCRLFFLLICEAGIFRSLASPDRLSSSGGSMGTGGHGRIQTLPIQTLP